MSGAPRFAPVADRAVLVTLARDVGDEASAAVLALDRALRDRPPSGVVEVVPAYVDLLVEFDPTVTDHVEVEVAVRDLLAAPPPPAGTPAEHVVEVCLDEPHAPDLAAVADAVGRTPDEVAGLFLAGTYRVAMYGFAPGYAYLAGVDPRIAVPRRPSARRDVPAGSVIVAGPQCLVTTLTMPTGWSVIGRSPTQILLPDADPPVRFLPGDLVRFARIDDGALARAEAS